MNFFKAYLINMHLYSSIKQNKKNDKPWISRELKTLIAEKYQWYNQHKLSQNYDVFDEFKNAVS